MFKLNNCFVLEGIDIAFTYIYNYNMETFSFYGKLMLILFVISSIYIIIWIIFRKYM